VVVGDYEQVIVVKRDGDSRESLIDGAEFRGRAGGRKPQCLLARFE